MFDPRHGLDPKHRFVGLPLPLVHEIDECAQMAMEFDDQIASLEVFRTRLFTESKYNEATDWDNPELPYNHMWTRYAAHWNRDIASLDTWTKPVVHSAFFHGRATLFTLTQSWDLFAAMTTDVHHGGDMGMGLDYDKRPHRTGRERRGSHLWPTYTDVQKEQIVRWYIDLYGPPPKENDDNKS